MNITTNVKHNYESYLKALVSIVDKANAGPVLSLDDLNKDETVLVIVDVLNGFAKEGALSSPRIHGIIAPISELLRKFKEKGMEAIAFADAHGEDSVELNTFPVHCMVGSHESEVVAELQAIGGYTLFEKNSANGFFEPAFNEWYNEKPHIRQWVVTGDCTDICILNFALAVKNDCNRMNRPSRVIVPLDCVDTYDSEGHEGDFTNLAAIHIMATQGIEFVKSII